jgi:Secretion system C-terminal sorting domain
MKNISNRIFLSLLVILLIGAGISAQPQVTVTVQESVGGCDLMTNCEFDTICVDIVMSVDIPKTLDSYNIWVEYDGTVISREGFGVNNNTPVGDNTCVIANGNQDTDLEGPAFNPDHWRVSGVPGSGFPMAANTPYTVHTICFIILQPTVLNGQQVCVGGNVSSLLTTVTFTDASSDTDVPETCMVLDGSFASCSILPVELLDFSAKKAGMTSFLNWSTSTEINSDYFEIQRAREDKEFEAIGIVKAAGNSAFQETYQFIDQKPNRGINYYRLKQFDLDGRFNLSPIRSLNFTESREISVYPNPVSNTLYVSLSDEDARNKEQTIFEIYDIYGKLMYQSESHLQTYKIDVSELQDGSYILSIVNGSVNTSHTFIKSK